MTEDRFVANNGSSIVLYTTDMATPKMIINKPNKYAGLCSNRF